MEKLLTIKDLSEWLQVTRSTIYKWTHMGYVPHYKLSAGVRFKVSDIEKWLSKRKRKGRNAQKIPIEDIV